MAPAKLIVFGPTGGIASVASVTARQLGADVVLAMRDPSKAITGLTPELEAKGGFERVQADLSKPETVRAAAEKTGAKHALIYLLHGSQDHMRGPIEALKAAGVEFVVFISSLSVRGVKPHEALVNAADNYISKAHAGVEATLAEVYGPKGYVALRPGFFDSNSLRWAAEIRAGGPVTLEFPKVTWDWIAPEDIGRVAAHIATKGPAALADAVGTHGGNHVLLAGPRLISLGDGIRLIAKAAGKPDIEIVALEDVEVAVRHSMEKHHMPEAIARALISESSLFTDEDMKVGPENVRRLGGGKVTTVEEWAEANKDKFA